MPLSPHPDAARIRNAPRISGSPLGPSLPFDWDAAVNRKPPPYATPSTQRRPRKSLGLDTPSTDTPGTRNSLRSKTVRVYRKVALKERVLNWIVQAIYDIQDFPKNRLPELQKVSRVLGGFLHLTHLIVRYKKLSSLRDEDIGWEDMLGERNLSGILEDDSWIHWGTVASFLLILISMLNATYLFTHIKYYHLFNKSSLASSPGAEFIDRDDLDLNEQLEPPPIAARCLAMAIQFFRISWSFLIGTQPPQPDVKTSRKVQRLSVWTPDRGAMELFIIYSPLHAFLWQAVSPGNWIAVFLLLVTASGQLFLMDHWYSRLVKDREIIAAEVLHEYDEKFVYPHIMRVRRDAAVMTNEAETITFYH